MMTITSTGGSGTRGLLSEEVLANGAPGAAVPAPIGTARSARRNAPSAIPRASNVQDHLADARRCLATAMRATSPADRYAAAHLGALRAAAALLACFPRPTSRTVRNASAWAQLDRVAPDFSGWTAYFAAGSAKRRAAEAGMSRLISDGEADELTRRTAEFIELVDRRLVMAA